MKKSILFVLLLLFMFSISAIHHRDAYAASNDVLDEKTTCKRDSILKIYDVLDLKGGTLRVAEKCTLSFEGGLIKNGNIIFDKNFVINPRFEGCRFEGTVYNNSFSIDSYGAKSGVAMDCSIIINDLINLKCPIIPSRSSKTILIPCGTFYIDNPIVMWGGWEAPVTIMGIGTTSTICQRKDNEIIFKIYESQNLKNLRITYKNRQSINYKKAVAIACQRAIFCQFDNLLISKANTPFGYISLTEAKKDGLTGLKDQCYMNCNFKNIRIYEFTGYAFDFRKELPRGDSGSVFDNIYISSNDWLSRTNDNVSMGAIRGVNSVINITQMNVEGKYFSSPLISLVGESILNAQTIHIEWLNNLPSLVKVENESLVSINALDLQSCTFDSNTQSYFILKDLGYIEIGSLVTRPDNRKVTSGKAILYTGNKKNIIIRYIQDKQGIFK